MKVSAHVVTLLLLLCLVVVSMATEDPKLKKKPLVQTHRVGVPPKQYAPDPNESTREKGKEAMVKLVKSDGEEVEISAEELHERTGKEEAKRKKIDPDTKEEVIEGKGSMGKIAKDHPSLNAFIHRGKYVFELLKRKEIVDSEATLVNLRTSDNPMPDHAPSSSEAFVVTFNHPDKSEYTLEILSAFVDNTVIIFGVWKLDAKGKREVEIPLPYSSSGLLQVVSRWMVIVGVIFVLFGGIVVAAMNRFKIKELEKEKEEMLAKKSAKKSQEPKEAEKEGSREKSE